MENMKSAAKSALLAVKARPLFRKLVHKVFPGQMGKPEGLPTQRCAYGVTYVAHSIPSVLSTSSRCRSWVQVRNKGTITWMRNPPDGHAVNLVLWITGCSVHTFHLPVEKVHPGESTTIPVEFDVPSTPEGLVFKFDLVHQDVTFFEDKGADVLVVKPIVVARGLPFAQTGAAEPVPDYAARFVEYRVPKTSLPGVRFGVWLEIQNLGAYTWDAKPDRGRQVRVAVRVDEKVEASSDLPSIVRPLDHVHVHLSVPAPLKTGRYPLKVDLVHEGVRFFEDLGSETLNFDLEVRGGPQPIGSALYETALRHNSWFYQPSSGVAFSRDGTGYPLFIERAKGCHVWDTEGRRYIDYTMGWGSALLGHAYPPVQKAVGEFLDRGAILPLPHPVEMEVARLLCEDIPCAEMVAFGKNGSDVCTLAVRLARLHTGRRIVLTCGYHGWQDWFAEALGFAYTGVPARGGPLTHPFRFNDPTGFCARLQTYREDLAAVMLEPAGASQAGQESSEDADREFLRIVAEKTREAGGLLIFDEIITGFRFPGGGLQKATGVTPDLACLGKALGAGMPISALVGRAGILASCMPRAFYGPTYKGEVYSLVAARTALETYRCKPVAEHVWSFGQKVKAEANRICHALGFQAEMSGPPFRFGPVFGKRDPIQLLLLRALYVQELLKQGVITYNGVMLPSYAHDEQALDETLAAMASALECVFRSARDGTLHRDLDFPPPRP
jgi:glutamate-1-semialdehyde 2,1-aminomutase